MRTSCAWCLDASCSVRAVALHARCVSEGVRQLRPVRSSCTRYRSALIGCAACARRALLPAPCSLIWLARLAACCGVLRVNRRGTAPAACSPMNTCAPDTRRRFAWLPWLRCVVKVLAQGRCAARCLRTRLGTPAGLLASCGRRAPNDHDSTHGSRLCTATSRKVPDREEVFKSGPWQEVWR